ncbi:TetR/AcrR family transcriptional regulator [Actibacterium sp. MT2.3-13A]|uniref:TetR/AcrR family transcriptional regulator n=1 Tax=Actibacterium sp. MT2.3-13A TaxID=2828332 RepID=UPI001BACF9D6|nr:TetR/AcrR family transcriptional regulator [Actibacterium sp. MT2.3-13A]
MPTEEKPDAEKAPRRRFSPAERERQIVDEAIRFFANEGFAGQTRELARRIGITQPLLYRYFDSKDALLDRVYDEVFAGRWKDEWEVTLRDRSRPLRDRLLEVYCEYIKVADNREWVRILLLAGIHEEPLNQRYLDIVKTRIVEPICTEVAHELGGGPSPLLSEIVWSFHGTFFYRAIRKWVYGLKVSDDAAGFVETQIDGFLALARTHLATTR